MHSRELGLVLAQQLGDVQDLHYGLWGPDLELSFSNLRTAQQRYSDMILSQLPATTHEICGAGLAVCSSLSRFVRTALHLLCGSPQPRPHSPVDRKRIYSACGKINEPAMVRKLAMTKQPREHRKN